MSVRKILFLAAGCLGLPGFLFLTDEIRCGRKSITFYGHTSFVSRVAISPDGKTLASGSSDNTVKLWDVATGRERATLKGHVENVRCVAFSPDGKTLASGSSDETVKLWDVVTGQERASLQGRTSGFSNAQFAVSPHGKTLATVGTSGSVVQLWNVAASRKQATLQGHTMMVYCVAFSPDGKTLATGSDDGTVRLWDVATGQERAILRAKPMIWVRSIAFSPDGKTLASGNADPIVDRSEVTLWDMATGQERKRLTLSRCGDESYLYHLAFGPDGKTLVAIETYTAIHVWDIASGENTASFNWYDGDKKTTDAILDAIVDKLPATCQKHLDNFLDKLPAVFQRQLEHVSWHTLYVSPNGKLVACGAGPGDTVKLLEVAAISKPGK